MPPQLAARMKWGYFVNLKGGKGKNIETDLAQEVSNQERKEYRDRSGSRSEQSSEQEDCSENEGKQNYCILRKLLKLPTK